MVAVARDDDDDNNNRRGGDADITVTIR